MLPHYAALIATAYVHRFSTAQQLRGFFPQAMASYRTANYQLSQLSDHGLLARVPVRAVMPTSPYVYIATTKGLSLVAEAYEMKTGRRLRIGGGEQRRATRGYGLQFMSHELAITDFDVAIRQLTEERQDVTLARTERRYHQPDKCLRMGESMANAVIPDAGYYLLHKVSGEHWLDLCFLEYDNGTMGPNLVREKLHRYERWATSDLGQQYLATAYQQCGDRRTTRPNFRLLLVVRSRHGEGNNLRRLAALATHARGLSRELRNRLWMTAADWIGNSVSLERAIWLKGRDIHRWLGSYLIDIAGTDSPYAPKQRVFVAAQLQKMPRYTLLPPRKLDQNE